MQRTIRNAISTSGIGLHSGNLVTLRMMPAAPNTGIIFYKETSKGSIRFDLAASKVTDTTLCTCLLSECGQKISTVEHLMAALCGMGIDNLIISIDGDEVPIMDGSAMPFVFLIKEAGIHQQNAPSKVIEVLDVIRVEDGDKFVEIKPGRELSISFSIDFNNGVIESTPQSLSISLLKDTFLSVANARTFGFLRDIETLQKHGLCKGGSLNNAIVIDDYRILNESGLRMDDEFVRHKILDAFGDFFMQGVRLQADIVAHKSGHHLNNVALNALIEQPNAWRLITPEANHDAIDEVQIITNDIGIYNT